MKKARTMNKVFCFAVLLAVMLVVNSTQVHAMKVTLTGYKSIDCIAERMIRSAGVKSTMSQDKKVKKIYHYMTTHFKHIRHKRGGMKVYYNTKKVKKQLKVYYAQTKLLKKQGKIKYSKKYKSELWNMKRRAGDCVDIAKIFVILCNHVGVKAGTCRGHYLNRNGSRPVHSWNYVKLNGKKYYYDVDVELKNLGKGQGDYYWYKKTYSQCRRNHSFH